MRGRPGGNSSATRGGQLYDRTMYASAAREFYENSDFHNFGYWSPGVRSTAEASRRLVDRLLAGIPSHTGRILDVACGLGATTRILLRHYNPADVVAINISVKQLHTASARTPDGRFVAMDAARLAFASASFDAVLCVEAAFHFQTREAFLREACRVLKPGGTLVLSDILFRTPPMRGSTRWVTENLVRDLDDYRAAYVRSGFSDVRMTDATAECWGGFLRALRRFGWARLRSRRLRVFQFGASVCFWSLMAVITERYLLVSATRPHGSSTSSEWPST